MGRRLLIVLLCLGTVGLEATSVAGLGNRVGDGQTWYHQFKETIHSVEMNCFGVTSISHTINSRGHCQKICKYCPVYVLILFFVFRRLQAHFDLQSSFCVSGRQLRYIRRWEPLAVMGNLTSHTKAHTDLIKAQSQPSLESPTSNPTTQPPDHRFRAASPKVMEEYLLDGKLNPKI